MGSLGSSRGGRGRRQQWIPRRSEAEKKRVCELNSEHLNASPSRINFLTPRRFRGAACRWSGWPQSPAVRRSRCARVRRSRDIEEDRENGSEEEWDRGREGFVVFIHARGEAAACITSSGSTATAATPSCLRPEEEDKRLFANNPLHSFRIGPQRSEERRVGKEC